jgi:hypothetical protein
LLVVVTSDLPIPDRVDGLEVVVTGQTSGAMVDRTFDLTTDWPHSVSVRPGQVESQGVLIQVTALRGGVFVARRIVEGRFVSGEQVTINVDIDAACGMVRCPDGQDCRDGRCVMVGMEDGGVPDGGTVDAGCGSAMDCDDMVNCTTDTCADGSCSHEPDDSLCADGTTCDPVDGCPPRVCAADGECADGVICNGAELCTDMACAAGSPIDCNDGIACTSDRCDEAARGDCVHTTRDVDGDRFGDATCPEVGGVPPTDCNDDDPDVNPDGVEVCNGLDDNCDGSCDEVGACCRGEGGACTTACGTTGSRTCSGTCAWDVCVPPAEMCNGVDDDCNGAPDDIFACVQGASSACITSCGSAGMRTCQADCTWGACVAPAELCNGGDDDCDGTPDNGFACVSGTASPCTTSCGSTGSITCNASTCMPGSCDPPAEGCTGVDDDCDGMIDETVECSAGTPRACTTSCGSAGSQVCSASCTYGACTPPAEICNGVDDDCDGTVDNGFTCVPGAPGTCTTSCSTPGTRTCTAACTWGTCTPPVEACNSADDDCDSMCDETFACCAGTAGACMTTCGTVGNRNCSASCGWSACSPPAESCNGIDDDCNSVCDDGFACCAGRTGACTTMCGSTGSRLCSGSCAWGSCTPPAEICNGLDDDCDGAADNGFACIPSTLSACTTSCGSTGTRTCAADCTLGACVPPAESCNGVDDDCDGMTDEGCGSCSGCAGATTVSAPGGRYMVTLGPNSQTGSCGGAGSEATLTFTLATISDVFITTHQAGSLDTVVYVRDCACTGVERACNDNADGRTTSVVRLTSLPAGTYNVFVDTKTPTSATVPVDVYITAPGAASDRCGNPTLITAGTASLSGNTCAFGADYSPATNAGCPYLGSGGANDRVYYFYVPTATTVSFDGCVSGSLYDETVYVRSTCSSTLAADQRECNDDGCSGSLMCDRALRSSMSVALSPGLYYFFADGYGGGSCDCGDFAYTVTGL